MKISIIGAGNMGGAIARGLAAKGIYNICVSNPSEAKLVAIKNEFPKVETTTDNKSAVAGADIAEDHKRGGVLLIALAEIRTVCRLADRVELQIAHQLRDLAHGLLVITDAQPFRFPFHSVSRLYFVSTIATGASASMVSPSSHS